MPKIKTEIPERELCKTFVDRAGNEWTCDISFDTVRKLKDKIGLDLTEAMTEPTLLSDALSDVYKLFDFAWILVADQAAEREIDEEAFGKLLAGDRLLAMRDAVGDAVLDFFSGPERLILDKMITAAREGEQKAIKEVEAKINSPEMDEAIQKVMNEAMETLRGTSGNGSGSGQAPAES